MTTRDSSLSRYAPPSLDTVAAELRRALARRAWSPAVAMVGEHWSMLLDEPGAILDAALREIPIAEFEADPRAAAVRDIRLHSASDAVERMLGDVALPDADDLRELEALARSDRALSLLSVTSSRMIALRVRGRIARAMHLATLVERLGRIAVVHRPGLISDRLPAALLQVGITRGLGDDLPGAVVSLRDAYERGPAARADYVQRDAAGKLALFHALAGDVEVAGDWLARHDRAPETQGWYRPRIALSSDIARTLVSAESLRGDDARAALRTLDQPVNAEQSWGAAVTYAASRYALAWGDRLGAIEKLRGDRERYADWLGEGTTLGPLLIQAEVDLLLSTGQLRQAQSALSTHLAHADHPAAHIARARIALVGRNSDLAVRHTASALAETPTTRVRVDAAAITAVASAQRGDRDAAATARRHLDDAVREHGLALGALALPSGDRVDLASLPDGHGARDMFPEDAAHVRLTPQQQHVLDGMAQGLSLRQIAERSHLSVNTMKTHSRALFRRLGASTRDEALARAHDAGLL